MISVLQRVSKGSVKVDGKVYSSIDDGYVVLLGIFDNDTQADVKKLVSKISNMRVMSDENKKMNKSIIETGGEVLLVSQFTLCADLTYGRRPSFVKAMKPDKAEVLYKAARALFEEEGISVQTGKFGEYMDVEIVNDGPVTIIVDTQS